MGWWVSDNQAPWQGPFRTFTEARQATLECSAEIAQLRVATTIRGRGFCLVVHCEYVADGGSET